MTTAVELGSATVSVAPIGVPPMGLSRTQARSYRTASPTLVWSARRRPVRARRARSPRQITSFRLRVCSESAGFTLIELLVLLAIVALLAALLLPALGRVKTAATSTACMNNLKELQLAWLSYVHENDDKFSPNISCKIGFEQINVAINGRVPWLCVLCFRVSCQSRSAASKSAIRGEVHTPVFKP